MESNLINIDDSNIENWNYDIEIRADIRKVKKNTQHILILVWIMFIITIFVIVVSAIEAIIAYSI